MAGGLVWIKFSLPIQPGFPLLLSSSLQVHIYPALLCSEHSMLPHTRGSIQAPSSLLPNSPPQPKPLLKLYLITKAFPDGAREKLIAPTPCHILRAMNAWAHPAQIALNYNWLSSCLTSPKGHEFLEERNLVFGTLPLSAAHPKSLAKCYHMVGT